MIFKGSTYGKIYFWSLVLLAVAIPLSEYFTSVFQFLLALVWLLEFNFREKLKRIKESKIILFFPALLSLHFIWLLNTRNFDYAFHDIQIKLPLFVIPVIIGSSVKLDSHHLKILLKFFIASVISGSLVSIAVYTGLYKYEFSDIREISIFISHIRFALMLVFSVFIMLFYQFFQKELLKKYERFIFPLLIIWIIVFLYILHSFTGLLILSAVALFMLVYYSFRIKHLVLKLFCLVMILTLVLLGFLWVSVQVSAFYNTGDFDPAKLETTTPNGNQYEHYLENKHIENGKYVWTYYCEPELSKEWSEKSDIEFRGFDKRGQHLRYTLVRYLTSRDLRKDSAGFSKLTDEEICNIENGIANYRFTEKFSPEVMIYKIIWQIDTYIKTGDPSGHSVTQRIEYLKMARQIIQENFFFGTGTGDVQDEFNRRYEKNKSPLPEKLRRRSHNQYITFFVSFGLIGCILALTFFFLPFFKNRKKWSFLLSSFILIIAMSMLNEDTLETQTGITFVVFFYCLLIFATDIKQFQLKSDGKPKE